MTVLIKEDYPKTIFFILNKFQKRFEVTFTFTFSKASPLFFNILIMGNVTITGRLHLLLSNFFSLYLTCSYLYCNA